MLWFIVIDDNERLLSFTFAASTKLWVLSAWGIPIGDIKCCSFFVIKPSLFDISSSAAIAESDVFANMGHSLFALK